MNKKIVMILGILVALLVVTGVVVYVTVLKPQPIPKTVDQPVEILPTVDASVVVDAKNSTVKDNTVILSVSGLSGKMTSVAYELSYESQGLVKGVNSGSKPIDVSGKDTFERDVYLGTCSRNVCKPDAGVKSVSIVLEFTDTQGKKSQFSKDFTL